MNKLVQILANNQVFEKKRLELLSLVFALQQEKNWF